MKNIGEKGQTLIETALIMILLLTLFFGIAEIARAWWLKNQLNNAARVGVRVAIVDDTLKTTTLPLSDDCKWSTSCTSSSSSSKDAIKTACASITNQGLCAGSAPSPVPAHVTLALVSPDTNPVGSGDTLRVTVTGRFVSVVPNLAGIFGLFRPLYDMSSDASMRYE